ncbi:MAG: hypothetical protein ACTHK8_18920 [Ginsengibacter sp.]
MTAKDQAKLLDQGFIIIRQQGGNLLPKKIKFKSALHREWKTMETFVTNAAMQRYANELLKHHMTVED